MAIIGRLPAHYIHLLEPFRPGTTGAGMPLLLRPRQGGARMVFLSNRSQRTQIIGARGIACRSKAVRFYPASPATGRDGAGPHPLARHAAPDPVHVPWAGWGPAPSLLVGVGPVEMDRLLLPFSLARKTVVLNNVRRSFSGYTFVQGKMCLVYCDRKSGG